MKFFHILIIVTIAILIGIVFDAQTALGGGWYPCCIEFKLDKTEYNTGDTVIITVRADQQYENSNENVIVKISDVTFGPDYANVIHQEEKTLEDGKAMFEYKTPQSPDRYRYLLTLESPAGVQSKLFFTKKDASKFVISDIKVLNPVLKQGEPVKFEAKVVDGVGNPAHYARILVTGDIPHETCSTEISGYAGAYLDLSPLYSLQPDYWSSGVVKGDVPITNTVMPGKYDLQVSVGGDIDGYVSSFEYFQIEIIPTDLPEDPPYTVFVPFQYDFGPGFMTEKPINITAKTAYNGCGSIIPNVPIKAEIKRYDLQNAQWMETLQTKEITSDENGVYHVSFEPIGLRAGYYNVLLTSTYQGVEQTIGVGTPNNIKNFTISEEGKDFTVTVDGWYFVPLDVTFDKENKKLTLELDTFDPFRRVDFKIPHELLDGEFRTVLVNGKERDASAQKYEGYTWFSPWPGEDDHTVIEVIGTSAI
ncbi:MAG TPA: hypothetical protein VLB45_01295, partial [Nitrosopumilaceae archaeon]|nr:hypothetical protein [Nitrosopumilaceae archaeon]